ncbi:hypothetical protein LXA43DRAFT_979232, partial [Ganoderma leucocontextum]
MQIGGSAVVATLVRYAGLAPLGKCIDCKNILRKTTYLVRATCCGNRDDGVRLSLEVYCFRYARSGSRTYQIMCTGCGAQSEVASATICNEWRWEASSVHVFQDIRSTLCENTSRVSTSLP